MSATGWFVRVRNEAFFAINPKNWDWQEGPAGLLIFFGILAMMALIFYLSNLIVDGLIDTFGRWGYLTIAVFTAVLGIWWYRKVVRRA